MKAVVLLAGMGRRICEIKGFVHKSLIPINGKPLLYYWIDNVKKCGINTLIPVLGYNGEFVLEEINKYSEGLNVCPVWNDRYKNTNNMVSLLCAASKIDGSEDIIQFNGDMIFEKSILIDMVKENKSCIAVDNMKYDYTIDSPKVRTESDRIIDIGRHINNPKSSGYAVGVYRYSSELWNRYCELATKLSNSNPNMGFHDPLRLLFEDNIIKPVYISTSLWMDVDDKSDIFKAESMVKQLGY